MILISNDFWHKRKIDNFDSYNVFLAVAAKIYPSDSRLCLCSRVMYNINKNVYFGCDLLSF